MSKDDFLPGSHKPLKGFNFSGMSSGLSLIECVPVSWKYYGTTSDTIDLTIEKVLQIMGLRTKLLSTQQEHQQHCDRTIFNVTSSLASLNVKKYSNIVPCDFFPNLPIVRVESNIFNASKLSIRKTHPI